MWKSFRKIIITSIVLFGIIYVSNNVQAQECNTSTVGTCGPTAGCDEGPYFMCRPGPFCYDTLSNNCSRNLDCCSGFICYNGNCIVEFGDGTPCTSNDQCASNYCQIPGGQSQGVCAQCGSVGSVCSGDGECCGSDSFCRDTGNGYSTCRNRSGGGGNGGSGTISCGDPGTGYECNETGGCPEGQRCTLIPGMWVCRNDNSCADAAGGTVSIPDPVEPYQGPVVNFSSLIRNAYGFLLPVAVGYGIIVIILAGYKIMTSRGDPREVKEGQEKLTAGVLGLIFVILSLSLLRFILRNFFGN